MEDPVVLSDGFTYERAFVTRWLLHKGSSPMTNLPLAHKLVFPNRALKILIERFKGNNNNADDNQLFKSLKGAALKELLDAEKAQALRVLQIPRVVALPCDIPNSTFPSCSYPFVCSVNGTVYVRPGLHHRTQDIIGQLQWYRARLQDRNARFTSDGLTADDPCILGQVCVVGFQMICWGGLHVSLSRDDDNNNDEDEEQDAIFDDDDEHGYGFASPSVFAMMTSNEPWRIVRVTQPKHEIPKHRINFGMCVDTDNALIYIYGGGDGHRSFGDLWSYSLQNNRFECLSPDSKDGQIVPPSRLYHAMEYCNGKIYVFGGAPDSKTTVASDPVFSDMWIWDCTTRVWKEVAKSDNGPSPRGSTCLLQLDRPFDRYLLLVGGFNGKTSLSDGFLFDTVTEQWISLGEKALPSARAAFGATVVGDKVFIVGGFDMKGYMGDSLILHISN